MVQAVEPVAVEIIEPTNVEIIDTPEVDLFSLVDINGNSIPIPKKLPWGKEKKILSIVGMAFEKVVPKRADDKNAFDPSSFLSFVENDVMSTSEEKIWTRNAVDRFAATSPGARIDATEILKFFANEAPEYITKLISIITGQQEAEIDEKYEGESVLQFAIPYIMYSIRKYSASFTQSVMMPSTTTMQ